MTQSGQRLADQKFVATTTYRRSGAPVVTPTWIVPLGEDRAGFWTSSASGKVKRLAADPRVSVQPSDARGRPKPDSAAVSAVAHVLESGPDFDAVHKAVRDKYGVMVPVSKAGNWLIGTLRRARAPYADRVVVIDLPDGHLPGGHPPDEPGSAAPTP